MILIIILIQLKIVGLSQKIGKNLVSGDIGDLEDTMG